MRAVTVVQQLYTASLVGLVLSFIACFIRPSGTLVREVFYFARDVFFLFFISLRVLRGPSADRRETWPHGRKLSEFYNPSQKIRGAHPQKNLGAKNMQNFGRLYTTSDFDREYLRNGSRYLKSES